MIVLTAISIILFSLGISLFIYSKNKTNITDRLGRRVVAKELARLPKEFKVLNNVTFIDTENKSFEIDHIVISRGGIFIIDSRNYSGCIYGEETDFNWAQTSCNGYLYFSNPIKENEDKIIKLKELFEIPDYVPFHNVILFSNNSTLKEVPDNVMYFKDIYGWILTKSVNHFLRLKEVSALYRQIGGN